MTSELKPELRLDKTGKAVTRHVRASGGPEKSTPAIPGPRTASAPSKKSLVSSIVTDLFAEAGWQHDYLGKALSDSASLKALKLIRDDMSSFPDSARLQLRDNILFIHGALLQVPQKVRERTLVSMSASTMTVHQFWDNSGPQEHLGIVQSAITTARSVGYRCDALTMHYDRELLNLLVLEQIVVGERNPIAPVEGLIRDAPWFANHMDDLAPHARTILERKSIDRIYCEELLKGGITPTLSEGYL